LSLKISTGLFITDDKYIHDNNCHYLGEVIKLAYVNVVGLISNDEEFSEIENVATVFIIEERMKDLTYNLKKDNVVKEKINYRNVSSRKIYAVRGLN